MQISTLSASEKRKINTQKRYQIIRDKFDQVYSQTVDGIRLDYDGVIRKVAEVSGYSEFMVKKILKMR